MALGDFRRDTTIGAHAHWCCRAHDFCQQWGRITSGRDFLHSSVVLFSLAALPARFWSARHLGVQRYYLVFLNRNAVLRSRMSLAPRQQNSPWTSPYGLEKVSFYVELYLFINLQMVTRPAIGEEHGVLNCTLVGDCPGGGISGHKMNASIIHRTLSRTILNEKSAEYVPIASSLLLLQLGPTSA